MKKLFSLIVLSFIAQSALAAAPATPAHNANQKNLSVNIDVNLQRLAHDGALSRHHIQKIWETAGNNHEWKVIQDQTNPNGHIVVLSKVVSADKDQVAIKFLVLDTSKETSIISAPEMIVKYGQAGKMILSENKQKMQLSVTATEG